MMMKLKKAKNLDKRLEAVVDNAFYTCCPPERYSYKRETWMPDCCLIDWFRHRLCVQVSTDTALNSIAKNGVSQLDPAGEGQEFRRCFEELRFMLLFVGVIFFCFLLWLRSGTIDFFFFAFLRECGKLVSAC